MAVFTANQFTIPSGAPADGEQPGVSFDGITVNNTTKAVTFNPNAVTGADVTFNKLTSGVSFFVKASSGNVSIGTNVPLFLAADYTSLTLQTNVSNRYPSIYLNGSSGDVDTRVIASIEYWDQYSATRAVRLLSRQDGSTATDRGGKFHIYTKIDGAATENIQYTVDNIGKHVFNASALAGGDFEVLSETSGTLIFGDVSTSRVGFGTNSPDQRGLGVPMVTIYDTTTSAILEFASDRADVDGVGILQLLATRGNYTNKNLGSLGIQLDGPTSNNRGSRFFVVTKEDGAATAPIHFLIDNIGKTTINVSALAGGDFEVLSETTGTTFFADASQGFVGIGKAGPSVALDVAGSALITGASLITVTTGGNQFERTSALTSSSISVVDVFHSTSGNMAAGFGASVRYSVEDDTSCQLVLGSLQFLRGAADTEGEFKLFGGTNGAEEFLIIDAVGHTVFNPTSGSTGNVRIQKQTSGILFEADVSAGGVSFGSNTVPTGIISIFDSGSSQASMLDVLSDNSSLWSFRFSNDTFGGIDDGHKLLISDVGQAQLYNNNNEFMRVDSVGNTIFNPTNDDLDVSILTNTTGTSLFVEASTGRIGIGTNTPGDKLTVEGVALIRPQTALTTATVPCLDLQLQTSGTPAVGLGPEVRFFANGFLLGQIDFSVDGSNEGKMTILAGTAGVEEVLSVGADLRVTATSSMAFNKNYGSPDFERETSNTSTVSTVIDLHNHTSADMVDGFGTSLRYSVEDDTSGQLIIGELQFLRGTADTEGEFKLFAGTNGAEEFLTIGESGSAVFNPGKITTADFTIHGDTVDNLIRTDAGIDGIAFFNAAAAAQPAHIADEGGTAVGTDATMINSLKTIINSLLAQHATLGLQAAS